jgi:hypothetical protein
VWRWPDSIVTASSPNNALTTAAAPAAKTTVAAEIGPRTGRDHGRGDRVDNGRDHTECREDGYHHQGSHRYSGQARRDRSQS